MVISLVFSHVKVLVAVALCLVLISTIATTIYNVNTAAAQQSQLLLQQQQPTPFTTRPAIWTTTPATTKSHEVTMPEEEGGGGQFIQVSIFDKAISGIKSGVKSVGNVISDTVQGAKRIVTGAVDETKSLTQKSARLLNGKAQGGSQRCLVPRGLLGAANDLFDKGNNWATLTGPHWAPVSGETPVVVEGTVVDKSFATWTDLPFDHRSHDWNFDVKPDAAYRNKLGPGNADGTMEMEWETANFPSQFWPALQDRVWMMGRHIYDCGHTPLKAEIHPPQAVAFMRPNQIQFIGNTPYSVTKTYIYIHGHGGYYDAAVGGRNYEFDIPLPKNNPSLASATPYSAVLNVPFGGIRPILTPVVSDPNNPHVHVVYPLSSVRPSSDNKFGAIVATGWIGPGLGKSTRTLEVTFDNIRINNDEDPGICPSLPLHPFRGCTGEWKLWASANGNWIPLLGGDIGNVGSAANAGTGDTLPLGNKVVVTVPVDGKLKIRTTGWEGDGMDDVFGSGVNPYTLAKAADANDQIGTIDKEYTSAQNFGIGSHDDGAGDFSLRYHITQLSAPTPASGLFGKIGNAIRNK